MGGGHGPGLTASRSATAASGAVAYSPDGATVALGGDHGKPLAVKLFEAATGKERLKIPFPDASSVRSVAFSPDGKTLAASGGSSTRLFDTATGKERLKIDRKAIGLRFSPDGATLVGAVAGTIYRWDAATGQSLIPEGGDSPVDQIAVTADGKRIVTRGQDGDAHIWDARTGEHQRRVKVGWQRGFALSPDGRFLVWPAADETIQFKDADRPDATHIGSRLRMIDLASRHARRAVRRVRGRCPRPVLHRRRQDAGDGRSLSPGRGGAALGRGDGPGRALVPGGGSRTQVWRSRLSPDGKVLAVMYREQPVSALAADRP